MEIKDKSKAWFREISDFYHNLFNTMQNILSNEWYKTWLAQLDVNLEEGLQRVQEKPWSAENFTFATAVSVMASSKIEGESLEVDSYVKHKVLHVEYLPNLTEKPNDLYEAYEFARDHDLTLAHFMEAHRLATLHLLPEQHRGTVRKGNMLIFDQQSQRIQYEAASADIVELEFDRFWEDVETLLQEPLSTESVFYYSALLHLVFVKIHPFDDGNGRTGRLLEKWFLASKLGQKAWYVPCELFYYRHLQDYYANLARVGLFYGQLDYAKGIPFLLMLPQALGFEA